VVEEHHHRSRELADLMYIQQKARARKAKELLISGKFSIVEIAHHFEFADQGHLTRHIKVLLRGNPQRGDI
jgi:AraC-like DNA-binding protein